MKINRMIERNNYYKKLAPSMSYNITDHLVASPKHGMKITTDSQTWSNFTKRIAVVYNTIASLTANISKMQNLFGKVKAPNDRG